MIQLIRRPNELVQVQFASLLAAALVWLDAPLSLRLPFGLLAVLLLPGYSFTELLFPRDTDLSWAERLALALSVSLAALTLLALVLNATPLGLAFGPLVATLTGFTQVTTLAAWWRRRRLPPAQRVRPGMDFTTWVRENRSTRLALGGLVVAGLVTGITVTVALGKPALHSTELYLLGSTGLAERYPREVVSGEQVEVTVGVANHEQSATSYRIEARSDDSVLAAVTPPRLEPESFWEGSVAFSLPRAGDEQGVTILLYRESSDQPYRQVRLWLNVLAAGVRP